MTEDPQHGKQAPLPDAVNVHLLCLRCPFQIIHRAAATDDPQQRKPNITRAKSLINWEPVVDLDAGIEKTVKYFKTYIANTDRK